MLTWVHFGDLHASDEDGWDSVRLFRQLTHQVDANIAEAADFAILPGDNANHGEPAQYRRVRDVLDSFNLPWFAVPGDHDFEPKGLENFYAGLGMEKLPQSRIIKGHRCIFLDIVSPGTGGPDFKLGNAQTAWLTHQLAQSKFDQERPVVFMHAFPGDFRGGGEALARLFADCSVASVDTGHTHYNEVLNDGGTIYTATRSTGQIEEGPPGFSVHAIDGSVASWRFKALDKPWPFVLITTPADYRLAVDLTRPDQAPCGPFTVRAKVFGKDVSRVTLTIDNKPAIGMTALLQCPSLWAAQVEGLGEGRHKLMVRATSVDGHIDSDTVEVDVVSHSVKQRELKANPGDHAHSIGAWPERGLLGTQLGPNKYGTIKW
jgi:hypothetical protein